MPLFTQSQNDILIDMLRTAMQKTGITTTSPGAKARAILEAMSSKLGSVSSQFEQNILQSYLDGAQGRYLDYIGDMMGVKRFGATPGSFSGNDKLLKFYREDSSNPLTIPSGTIVSTESGGTGTAYRTIIQADMPSGSEGYEMYVSAISTSTGSTQNIAKETLVYHNLSNQPDLKVTNEADIVLAQDTESDSNFRFRIANQVFAAEKANLTAIRIAALNVPGIADVTILPFFRGVGTFDILLKATTPTVPDSLVGSVRESLYFTIAQGVSFNVRSPKETGISMEINVTLSKPSNSDVKKTLQSNIQEVIMSYLDNLDIGESIIINEIVQRVMAVDDTIKNIGSAGKPIQKITRWDEMETDPTKRISSVVFNALADPIDMDADVDEKFFTETDFASTPIFVNILD